MAKKQEFATAERLAAEGGIASDESAVAELEIKTNENPTEEPENEPAESTAAKGDSGEAGCPIRMGDYDTSQRCGRKIHPAPDGIDENPVCLMHSKDPRKHSGLLCDAFWQEFERVLAEAGEGEAHFEYFVFPVLDFSKRTFQAICRFDGATFTQKADFSVATFTLNAHFSGSTFTQNADFFYATFMQNAHFDWTTFRQMVSFQGTKFRGTITWRCSRFLDQTEFRRTKFEHLVEGKPSAVFALAMFSKPREVVFDNVDLSRAIFHNCDVSQVWFTSSVRWAMREGTRGIAVFEETIPLEHEIGTTTSEKLLWMELQRDGQRDYRAVAQIYQQLKKNYDSRLDYWTANEFHFGEMEMKRLAVPASGRLLWLRQWWHRNLSFVAWYRFASDYGNNYRKPLLLLLFFVLFLFPAAFPFPSVGLRRHVDKRVETYFSVWDYQKSYRENFWKEKNLALNSLVASVDIAEFQKSPEFEPALPRGHVLAIYETLLTSSLFALFLLAIRRQFRR